MYAMTPLNSLSSVLPTLSHLLQSTTITHQAVVGPVWVAMVEALCMWVAVVSLVWVAVVGLVWVAVVSLVWVAVVGLVWVAVHGWPCVGGMQGSAFLLHAWAILSQCPYLDSPLQLPFIS